ncbi:hypothetical protein BJ170DRAFT_686378 [Xylariales sp. AK1849]|nr:hypothetical protein BJ170DRAFT_686378 [Xylariales sp. AK1849]
MVAPNPTAISNLVLPQNKKNLQSSLAKERKYVDTHFDDHIKGERKYLIFLLYGSPGVDEKFATESFADHG